MILPSILDFLADRIGLDSQSIGLPNIEAAVRERARECGQADLSAYGDLLRRDETEQEALIEQVVVSETWFFRDQAPFQFLAVNAVRKWATYSFQPTHSPLRILSLPCASGEEPYSIAMTLFDAGFQPGSFEIEAVDVSEKALQHGRAAIYKQKDFRGKNLDVLQRFFSEERPDELQLIPKVRNTVRFSKGTLLHLPFAQATTRFHMIFCRNLLIYLNQNWRQRAVAIFKELLHPDGLLFIGHADATPVLGAHFTMVRDASAFAYQLTSANKTSGRITPPSPTASVPAVASSPPKPTLSPATLDQLRTLIADAVTEEALAQCRATLIDFPDNPELYFLLGSAHERLGHIDDARQAWQKSLYLNPQHADALRRLRSLLDQIGDTDAASRIDARIQRLPPTAT